MVRPLKKTLFLCVLPKYVPFFHNNDMFEFFFKVELYLKPRFGQTFSDGFMHFKINVYPDKKLFEKPPCDFILNM